jgi:hypothetical protein
MATGDLATLSEVKELLSIKGADDDAVLSRLITSVSSYIKQELNNPILSAAYTEAYDGTGRDMLVLPQWPITDVTAVTVSGVPVAESPDGVASGYILSDMAIILLGGVFPKGRRNVRVSYVAGFAAVPPEVAQVVTELVALAHKGRPRIGEKSRSLQAGGSTSYADLELTPLQRRMLKNYNRTVPL